MSMAAMLNRKHEQGRMKGVQQAFMTSDKQDVRDICSFDCVPTT